MFVCQDVPTLGKTDRPSWLCVWMFQVFQMCREDSHLVFGSIHMVNQIGKIGDISGEGGRQAILVGNYR